MPEPGRWDPVLGTAKIRDRGYYEADRLTFNTYPFIHRPTTEAGQAHVVMVAAVCLAVVLAGCGSNGSGTATATSAESSLSVSPSPVSSTSTSSTPASSASTTRSSSDSSTSSAGSATPDLDPQAAAYCEQRGGEVQTRTAYYGTNGDQANWLELGETTSMCRFQADDEAKSRIYVDLTTLSSSKPTLAALAYLSKVPMPPSSGGANPASGYCTKELSGSSTFGAIGASGGGWVAKGDPDDVVVNLCVFPDLSFIDEWGLTYHSNGDIRGTDLATAMQYQPGAALPPVFPTGTATPIS